MHPHQARNILCKVHTPVFVVVAETAAVGFAAVGFVVVGFVVAQPIRRQAVFVWRDV